MQIFFGSLRESEIERVNERISQAVMETCLAMTIFRDEFNVEFVAMFVILTFIKVFHWLVQDRVDYLETTPTVSRLHHLRITSFICLLGVRLQAACFYSVHQSSLLPIAITHLNICLQLVDAMFLTFTVSKTLERSASVHLLFAFEYVIQTSVLASTAIKYGLSLIDNYFEGRWENKVSMSDGVSV